MTVKYRGIYCCNIYKYRFTVFIQLFFAVQHFVAFALVYLANVFMVAKIVFVSMIWMYACPWLPQHSSYEDIYLCVCTLNDKIDINLLLFIGFCAHVYIYNLCILYNMPTIDIGCNIVLSLNIKMCTIRLYLAI